MENLNKYCRCCGDGGMMEVDLINIFDNQINSIEVGQENLSLAEAIKDLTCEMVEPNDGLPILICQLCKCKLSNAYSMKYKIKHTAIQFYKLIKSKNIVENINNKSHQLITTDNYNNKYDHKHSDIAITDDNNNHHQSHSIIAEKSHDDGDGDDNNNDIKPKIMVSLNSLQCDKKQQLEEITTAENRYEVIEKKVTSTNRLDCDIKYKGFKKHIINEAEEQNQRNEQLIINNTTTITAASENLNNNNNNNNNKQMLTRGMLEKRKALAIQIKTKKIKPTTEYLSNIAGKLTTTITMLSAAPAVIKRPLTPPPPPPPPPPPVQSKNTKDIAMLTDKLIKSLSSNDDSLKIQITNRGGGGGGRSLASMATAGSTIEKWPPNNHNELQLLLKCKPTDNLMLKMEKSIENLTDAVSFVSDENFQKFIQSEELKKIAAYEKRRHPCAICHKRFVGKSNLVDHLRYHANVRPFQCNYCERTFIQISSLKSHERVHTKERPYHCNICEKMFSQSSALKMHIRTHTNERKYKCIICDKAFVSQGDLGKHKRIHESIKPFYCDLCKKGFAQKCNLQKHLNIIHKSDNNDR